MAEARDRSAGLRRKLDREPAGAKGQRVMPLPLTPSGRAIHLAYFLLHIATSAHGAVIGFHHRQRIGGHDMTDDLMAKWELSRRRVLGGCGRSRRWLGTVAAAPSASRAVRGACRPRARSIAVNFVVWTYGDIYTRIAKQFETDWGVKVEFDHLLVQRPSDQAHHHVRGRREDRRLAILALLLPQLREPGPGRADRRPAGRRRLHQGLHALHQAGGDGRRQDHGPALLLRGVGLELLHRHAGEAEDRQAVHDLRRVHRALRQGQEGRRVALSHPVGRGRRPRAAAGHLVPDDLEQRRHLLRQAGQPHARAPARSPARR